MIPKGLKVGDTFDDGGNTYKVLNVVGENYESQLVKTAPINFSVTTEVKEVKKEVQEVKSDLSSDLSSVPYAQLKKLCAERGLDATGSKVDLIARLEG